MTESVQVCFQDGSAWRDNITLIVIIIDDVIIIGVCSNNGSNGTMEVNLTHIAIGIFMA